MAGHVEAKQFLFMREQFMLRPLREACNRLRHGWRLFFQPAEQGALSFLLIRLNARRPRKCALDLCEQRSASLAKAVARTTFDQCFKNLLVDRAAVHALTKVGERRELPPLFPSFENVLHGDLTHSFDRSETETNRLFLALS